MTSIRKQTYHPSKRFTVSGSPKQCGIEVGPKEKVNDNWIKQQ